MSSLGRKSCARQLVAVLLSGVVLTLPGCGGCSQDPQAEAEAKKKAEEEAKRAKRPDFEFQDLVVRPHEVDRPDAFFKPGHWASATLVARANNFDFRGALETQMQDNQGLPLALDPLPYRLDTERPLVLAKGQMRSVELTLFAPPHAPRLSRAATRILPGPNARMIVEKVSPLVAMPAHQYFFVVLAGDPLRYSYLASLDSVRAPSGSLLDPAQEAHYRLVVPKPKEPLALPNNALEWTSIAYVLWDDRPPDDLSAEQQQALVDWLHWGGQLIVSGPDSLDTLRGSFLSDYLPAESAGARQLDSTALAALNEPPWSRDGMKLNAPQAWAGVKLELRVGATRLLQSANELLLVEQRVGRGRVLVSAFPLYGRDFVNWPGCDGFFNASLLRRPGRTFKDILGGTVQVDWTKSAANRYDPSLVSQVRYLTRTDDVRPPSATARGAPPAAIYGRLRNNPNPGAAANPFGNSPTDDYSDGPPLGPGVGGWADFDAAAVIARERLREAAGIVVPDASFVVWVLAGYLVVLVPLNWAVFKLIGRVEWAWVAAPVITIGFAMLVVRLAQLDIGFARARTEIAVLELQPGYERAHLTRYTALYSSLGTSYGLEFEDPQTLALPFPPRDDELSGQAVTTVRLRRARKSGGDEENPVEQVLLENFVVSSNTTAMVHSEQMVEMGGTIDGERIDADVWQITNRTPHALAGACLCVDGATYWIGSLAPGATQALNLKLAGAPSVVDAHLDELPLTSKQPPSVGVNIRRLIDLLRGELGPNEARLVGWSEEPWPGVEVSPSTAQSHVGNLIVAHVRYGAFTQPQACLDANSRAQVQREAGGRRPEAGEEVKDE